MAELTFKSAGVSTREIDLSGPTPTGPQGVPAGIIGTAVAGPAFVPITFATFSEFNSIFGGADGEKFGPIAVNEWLKNARACTYLRVLGVGDGKKRSTNGQVTNAGFVVGSEIVQDNGQVGINSSANPTVTAVASKLVLTIGNGVDNTVPAASDQVKFTAGDGTNTDLTIALKFNSGGTNDTAVQADGTRAVDFETDVASRNTPVLITNALFTALNALTSAAVSGVDLSGYSIVKDISNIHACTITLTANSAEATKYDSTYTETGGGFVDTNNIFAAAITTGVTYIPGIKGRTYFLGAFHSESNGSTIFSDAGIQKTTITAAASALLTFTNAPTAGQAITIVTTDGTTKTFQADNATTDGTLTTALFSRAGSKHGADNLKTAIEASSIASKVTVSAVGGSDPFTITVTQNVPGVDGNTTVTNNLGATAVGAGSAAANGVFSGGLDDNHAVPILRGVVLAPSGVILHLSGNRDGTGLNDRAPGVADTALPSIEALMGRKGTLTGSVDMASKEFVMLMNGFKGDASTKTVITASFDMTAPNYFANVFNTDPLKIEEKGHYLYGHYDIYPTMATVTGSGVFSRTHHCQKGKLDVAFLLTSSMGRGATPTETTVDYEDFQDRFNAPATPFIISQEFDRPLDLFKLESINDGAGDATAIKVSIENIKRRTSDVDKFGTFDLLVRNFEDTDDEKKVLESFRGLSLDPGSDRYIGRSIGDQKIFFNFDNDTESQKIVIDGTHPVRSRFVRVVLSDAMKKKEVPDEALPMGYRGPQHLLTSGSLLATEIGSEFLPAPTTGLVNRVVEPPVPYRQNIAIGLGVKQRADARFYWGMQTARKTDPAQLNKVSLIDESWRTFNKHFPNHRSDNQSFSVNNNPGAADVGGTVLDCDKFNNNQFSLEKVQVITGSDGFANSDSWKSAEYVRAGSIVANTTNKTRKFKTTDLDRVANRKYAKFTVPVQGGFDGTNIFNKSKRKLENVAAKREMDQDLVQGGTSGPTVSAYRKAVDIMGSKSDTEIQLLAIPGIRHPSVTDFAITAVESRFDAMYIMDIEERDQFNTVITSSVQKPHVLNTVNDLKNRALDTSFAATYFPDLTIPDPKTNALVQVPPSVAVLGAYALNDRVGHPWFAPAGFTRGSLTAIESTSVKLNRTNLDDLYDSDINPITAFPGTGITVWGQKTLLQRASALDRINVRRLLISVRRSVRNIANSLLFEPNREETLEKFSSLVNPVLQRVQELSGVDRYKVIIDTTTTTQADVENNTIRGKIFLQPTRTVEFVALDFVVTNAGSELL